MNKVLRYLNCQKKSGERKKKNILIVSSKCFQSNSPKLVKNKVGHNSDLVVIIFHCLYDRKFNRKNDKFFIISLYLNEDDEILFYFLIMYFIG